jgi:hypothetical protein
MIERRSLLGLLGLAPFIPMNWVAALRTEPQPPELPSITYRTSGKWGEGSHDMLTARDVDYNFYVLEQRLLELEKERGLTS